MSEGSMHAEPSTHTPAVQDIQPGESMLNWLRQFGQGAINAFQREIHALRRGGSREPDVPTDVTPLRRVTESVE
jgi:hypothetical protein